MPFFFSGRWLYLESETICWQIWQLDLSYSCFRHCRTCIYLGNATKGCGHPPPSNCSLEIFSDLFLYMLYIFGTSVHVLCHIGDAVEIHFIDWLIDWLINLLIYRLTDWSLLMAIDIIQHSNGCHDYTGSCHGDYWGYWLPIFCFLLFYEMKCLLIVFYRKHFIVSMCQWMVCTCVF